MLAFPEMLPFPYAEPARQSYNLKLNGQDSGGQGSACLGRVPKTPTASICKTLAYRGGGGGAAREWTRMKIVTKIRIPERNSGKMISVGSFDTRMQTIQEWQNRTYLWRSVTMLKDSINNNRRTLKLKKKEKSTIEYLWVEILCLNLKKKTVLGFTIYHLNRKAKMTMLC